MMKRKIKKKEKEGGASVTNRHDRLTTGKI